MRQVMPMAAGLASGLALSSFGVFSAALAWGLGSTLRGTGQFGRGLMDTDTSRRDPLARQAGYALRRGAERMVSLRWRDNQIRRRA
jgi:type IV secretion system protein VirB6